MKFYKTIDGAFVDVDQAFRFRVSSFGDDFEVIAEFPFSVTDRSDPINAVIARFPKKEQAHKALAVLVGDVRGQAFTDPNRTSSNEATIPDGSVEDTVKVDNAVHAHSQSAPTATAQSHDQHLKGGET